MYFFLGGVVMVDNTLVLIASTAGALFLGVLIGLFLKSKSQLNYLYSYDICKNRGYFKDKTKVIFKARLMINNVPHGDPIILGTHEFSEVDPERLKDLIQTQLIPLMKETSRLMEAGNQSGNLKKWLSS